MLKNPHHTYNIKTWDATPLEMATAVNTPIKDHLWTFLLHFIPDPLKVEEKTLTTLKILEIIYIHS